jgi:hypothetical protein
MEIRPVGTTLINENRWTDLTRLIGSFCDYGNAPKENVSAALRNVLHKITNGFLYVS